MPAVHPKTLFEEAKRAESEGNKKVASSHYASLCVYLRKKGNFDEAKRLIERALSLSPNAPRLLLQLALCEVGMGKKDLAVAAVRKFSEQVIRLKKTEKYQPYVDSVLRDFPELRQVFIDAVLEIDRTTAAPFLAKANSYRQKGEASLALKAFIDALKTKTMESEILQVLEMFLKEEEDSTRISYLNRYLEGKIKREKFLELLIAEKEVKIKKEFVSRNKKDEKEEKGLGSLISDLERDLQIEIRDPNTELAPLIKEFRRQSESILAGDSQARLDMALAFFEMDLFLEAKDEISKIQKQDPYYVEAQFLLAQLFISEGSELGALEAYQKCFRASVKGSAPYFEALYQLSWTYFRLEDYSNSDFHLEELEKQKPDYRDSRTLRKRLDFLVQKKAG